MSIVYFILLFILDRILQHSRAFLSVFNCSQPPLLFFSSSVMESKLISSSITGISLSSCLLSNSGRGSSEYSLWILGLILIIFSFRSEFFPDRSELSTLFAHLKFKVAKKSYYSKNENSPSPPDHPIKERVQTIICTSEGVQPFLDPEVSLRCTFFMEKVPRM